MNGTAFLLQFFEVFLQPVLLGIAQCQINTLHFRHGFGVQLGVAADHGNFPPGRNASRGGNGTAGLGFRLSGHGAGIDHRQIGSLLFTDNPVPRLLKFELEGIGLGVIQPAAQGSKIDRFNQNQRISTML